MISLRRTASIWLCNALSRALPEHYEDWGRAIRAETDSIDDDAAALLFALDALRGVVLFSARRMLSANASRAEMSPAPDRLRTIAMATNSFKGFKHTTTIIGCGTGAVLLGLGYLSTAAAPPRMLVVNALALVLGLLAMTLQLRAVSDRAGRYGITTLLLACVLFATGIGGLSADGVSRWISIGPFPVQPSLIVLPVMLLMFLRERSLATTASILIAAASMAVQPDRAMAAVLMLGLASIAIARSDRLVLTALAGSVLAFVVAMAQPDEVPATSYVDQVLFSAFDVSLAAGIAVVAGAGLLLAPAVYGFFLASADRAMCAVFGMTWSGIIVAAAVGNYPTPLVGYGGSAILGYFLSLGPLLASVGSKRATASLEHAVRDANTRAQDSLLASTTA